MVNWEINFNFMKRTPSIVTCEDRKRYNLHRRKKRWTLLLRLRRLSYNCYYIPIYFLFVAIRLLYLILEIQKKGNRFSSWRRTHLAILFYWFRLYYMCSCKHIYSFVQNQRLEDCVLLAVHSLYSIYTHEYTTSNSHAWLWAGCKHRRVTGAL